MKDNKKELLKEAIQNMKENRKVETLGILDKFAEEGDPEAMYWLAERYKCGIRIRNEDIPQSCDLSYVEAKRGRVVTHIHSNRDKSIQLLQRSADLGFPPAQHKIGIKLSNPLAKDKDYDKAFLLFKLAAEQDYAPAMYALSRCYFNAQGTAQNIKEGIKWCKKAAEAEHPMAEYRLARFYLSGQDIENDSFEPKEPYLNKMFYWLRRAAEHGQMFAQYELAKYLLDGHGTEKNEQEAIEWLKKSGKNGLCNAINKLGELGIAWEDKAGHFTLTEK